MISEKTIKELDPDRRKEYKQNPNNSGNTDSSIEERKPRGNNPSSTTETSQEPKKEHNYFLGLIIVGLLICASLISPMLFKWYSQSRNPNLGGKGDDLEKKVDNLKEKVDNLESRVDNIYSGSTTKIASSSVNHYMAIDRSESANNDPEFQNLEQKYCQTNISQYIEGDRQSIFQFASFREPGISRVISSEALKANNFSALCSSSSGSRFSNLESGTSLIDLLDSMWFQISTENSRDNIQPTIITVLIQHEEPGENLLNTRNHEDMKKLASILSKLQKESATVVILSPVESLIQRLENSLVSSLDNTYICPANKLDQCIKQGFDAVRQDSRS